MQNGGHSVSIEVRYINRENNKRTVRRAFAFEEQGRENL